VPIGVETHWVDGKLRLRATVVAFEGNDGVDSENLESITSPEAADEYGKRVALELVQRGAGKILDAINAVRPAAGTE
jgi:hydroxymethylbilane synthase